MEFKLNKIDTDIRRKMQEKIKEDKVHFSKKTDENKDVVQEKEFEQKNKQHKAKSSETDKRFIIVEATKNEEQGIKIQVEKVENINEMNSKGRILDAKK